MAHVRFGSLAAAQPNREALELRRKLPRQSLTGVSALGHKRTLLIQNGFRVFFDALRCVPRIFHDSGR